MKEILRKKILKIKLVITDVDGVLTDGSRYFTGSEELFKKFHVRDGMGVNILLRNNIPTIIITKEKTKIVTNWAKEMNVKKVYLGITKKEGMLDQICNEFSVHSSEILFIGDDVNDLELMKEIGFSCCPNDGSGFVKKIVDYICNEKGGRGAFREVVDLLVLTKFENPKLY